MKQAGIRSPYISAPPLDTVLIDKKCLVAASGSLQFQFGRIE